MAEEQKKPTYHEVTLSRRWLIELTPVALPDFGLHTVDVRVSAHTGYDWEEEICGQVKYDGCANWGLGEMCMHFCGEADCGVLLFAYRKAAELFGDGFEGTRLPPA